MNPRISIKLAATALVGTFGWAAAPDASAQIPGSAIPRTADERVAKELPTSPPVNSDYRRAAEGQLPPFPNQAVPGQPVIGGRVTPRTETASPAGLDVAIVAEHALGMAIEAANLLAIIDLDATGQPTDEPSKTLFDHSQRLKKESMALMKRANEDGQPNDPKAPVKRFTTAANSYLMTLETLSNPKILLKPSDKAQVALINHAVKETLDADHIRQFGRAYGGSPAIEQLMNHASAMRAEGQKTVARLADSSAVAPNAMMNATILAQRAVELLDTADQLNRISMPPQGANGTTGGFPQPAINPASLLNTRPEIIGGTYSSGSPSAGTSTGAEGPKGGSLNPGTNTTPNDNPKSPVSIPPR